MNEKVSRRDILKLSGAALGSLAVVSNTAESSENVTPKNNDPSQQDSLFESLKPYTLGTPLGPKEMRITFMGTSVVQRRTQACSSVFVELGNGESFVFDCGSGVTINYSAMQIPMSKMRKIFLTHLHGDHTSDLTHIYCFGAQQDGKSPLYIWGPSPSGIPDPITKQPYDDGTVNFCQHFREMNRWHTESQSFVPTQWEDAEGDGYDIFATELNWQTGDTSRYWSTNPSIPKPESGKWLAYQSKDKLGKTVKIWFFPAVHDRNGSVSYKLEWNDLSMIFTGDTKPNRFLINNATNGTKGVDVLISEMVVPPEVWAIKNGGNPNPTGAGLLTARTVQENSHTPEKALGYILNETAKLGKAPRLAVATHFQAEDDTIYPALHNIRTWYSGDVTVATDLMVITVSKESIQKQKAVVSDFSWFPLAAKRTNYNTKLPKYNDTNKSNPYYPNAPLAQFDQSLLDQVIDPCLYDPTDFGCTHPYPSKS